MRAFRTAALAGAASLALSILAAPVVGAPIAAGHAATPLISAVQPAAEPESATQLGVEILALNSPVLARTSNLEVTVAVSNNSSSAVILDSVELTMSGALATRTDILTFLATQESAAPQLTGAGLAEGGRRLTVAANSTVNVNLTVPASRLTWGDDEWGARGLEVVAASGDLAGFDRSLLVLAPPAGIKKMPTGVVLPLTASAAELATREASIQALTEPAPELPARVRELGTLAGPGVSVVADPAYIEAAAGAAQIIETPGRDADIVGLVHAEAADTVAELLAAATPSAILAAPGLDEATLEVVSKAGKAAVIVCAEDAPTDAISATPRTHTHLDIGDGVEALVVDSAASSALAGSLPESSAAAAGEDAATVSPLDARQLTLALSAATYREQPDLPRPQLLALDRADVLQYGSGAPGSRAVPQLEVANLDATIDALMAAEWVQPATVDMLVRTDPSTLTRHIPTESEITDDISPSQAKATASGMKKALRVADLLKEPEQLAHPATELAEGAYSVAWRADVKGRSTYINGLTSFFTDIADAITPVASSTINVIAEDTELPVRVQNKLPFAAATTVELDSVSARLSPKSKVVAELNPASTTTVNVPVTARGSGDVDAHVQLRDAGGQRFGHSEKIHVRVRAEWENWATFTFAGLVLLALVAGLVTSFRRGRRSRPITASEYTTAQRSEARKRKGESLYPQLHFPPVGDEAGKH